MCRKTPVLVFALAIPLVFCATSCGYLASVRGVLAPEVTTTPAAGARVCVEKDPNAPDQGEIDLTQKIEFILADRGYRIVSAADAEYYLFFNYERKSLMRRVRLEPLSGTRSGIATRNFGGPYDQELALRLVEADAYESSGLAEFVWAGGAVMNNVPTVSPRFADLLLVAGMKYFPEDTERVINLKLRLNDARARKLQVARYPESPPARE